MTFKPQKRPSAAVRTLLFGLGIMLSSTVFAAKPVKPVEPAYATQAALEAEISERKAADAGMQTQIDAEAADRISADTDLQSQLDSETTDRSAAITELQSQINVETSARTGGDTDLQNQVSDLQSQIADLQSQIDAVASPSTRYFVGDTGPAGGIVFYVTDNGLHGMEAAPVDKDEMTGDYNYQSYSWGCDVTGADGTAIGTGRQNTADIQAGWDDSCGIGYQLYIGEVESFGLNGFEDWFVPSKDELNEMILRGVVGDHYTFFWSSTEYDNNSAWAVQVMINTDYLGNESYETFWTAEEDKSSSYAVHLIRAF